MREKLNSELPAEKPPYWKPPFFLIAAIVSDAVRMWFGRIIGSGADSLAEVKGMWFQQASPLCYPLLRLCFPLFTPSFVSKATESCDSLALLQGSFGPSRPKVGKRVGNEFPGPLGFGAQKVAKQSRQRVKVVENSRFDSFSTRFSTFWAPGPRGPGNSFSDSFSGPDTPNDPCSGCFAYIWKLPAYS